MPEESLSASALGGETVSVTFKTGETGTAFVRELEIDPSLLTFAELLLKERELVEFVCAQPAGWALTLKPASLLEIVEKAKALNLQSALRYMKHRADALERLRPLGVVRPAAGSTTSAPAPA